MQEEDEPLPLSALQHWLFCPRQAALIHVERLWAENSLTAEGRILHERTDSGGHETRPGLVTIRALPIASARLGVAGVADVVELHGSERLPFPVEYKRGRPKAHRADEVQLCAQACCLEEMFDTTIPAGALFYGQTRRRLTVVFDDELRALTARIADEARTAIAAGHVPAPIYERKRCSSCSLIDKCWPKRLQKPPNVRNWLARMVAESTA